MTVRLAALHTDYRAAARAGPGGCRRGAQPTAGPSPGPPPGPCCYGSVDRLPARTHGQSRETRCCTPSPESAWPVGPCSGVAWRRLVSPASLPEVLPENVLPGVAFPPVGPWDLGSPPSRPGAHRSQPAVLCAAKTAKSPSRGRAVLPLLPRCLGSRLWLCVPCLCQARVRGGRRLATPGVFTSSVGTPTPALPQGDHGLSHVPASPL